MMKKIFGALIVLGVIGIASCDVTNLQPKDVLASSVIFSDSANIDLAVVGVYHSTQTQLYGYNGGNGTPGGGDNRGYPFGAAYVEQAEMRGEDLVNTQGFYAIVYGNTETSASPNCVNLWSGLFEVINQANTVLAGLSTTKAVKPASAASYSAEMRFLRALAYHELLIFFARPYSDAPSTNLGVPIRTTPSQDNVDAANAVGRNTVADCYTQIIADLDFAEANLPATRNDQLQVTRATKGAAIALKTRVYQHMNDWNNVAAEGAKLITSFSSLVSPIGGYTLNASPGDAFTNPTTNESVFSMEYSSVDQGSVNGGLGSAFLPADVGGRGLIGISPNLYNATFWTATDSRRTDYVIMGSIGDGKTCPYINKYKDPVTNTDYTPLIRYSEVLLNYSEALAQNGDLSNSLLLLNAVRNRAVAAADQYTAASFGSQAAQIQAILNERRIEFIGEGRRWPDLHRLSQSAFGLGKDVNNNLLGVPSKLLYAQYLPGDFVAASGKYIYGQVDSLLYTDHRFLYPISNVEVANNPTLAAQQNPGY